MADATAPVPAIGWPASGRLARRRAHQLLHEPERTPADLAESYPAHLHVNLQRRARGRGLGRELIERLLVDLRARGVSGVHLGVDEANVDAIGFYAHLGFREAGREPGGVLMGLLLHR